MAIAFTNLGVSVGQGDDAAVNPDINSNTDASSYANSSWTPPTSDLIVVWVESRRVGGADVDTPTISGNGLTWVQIGSTFAAPENNGISLFGANASGSSAGVTTIDFVPFDQTHCVAHFFQVTEDIDLSGGVAAAFVQTQTDSGTGTSGSITLNTAGDSANRPISFFWHKASQVSTERANWTELDDTEGTSRPRGDISQYRDDAFEITATASWATSVDWGGMAAELKSSAGVGPPAGAPVWQEKVEGSGNSTTIDTASMTPSGSDVVLVAMISYRDTTDEISDVRWRTSGDAGDALVALRRTDANNNAFVAIFYLIAPAQASRFVRVTYTTSERSAISASYYTNAHQTTPFRINAGSNGTDNSPTVTIASGALELTVDALAQVSAGPDTATADHTQRANLAALGGGDDTRHASQEKYNSSAMGWTMSSTDSWAIAAGVLQPPAVTDTFPAGYNRDRRFSKAYLRR